MNRDIAALSVAFAASRAFFYALGLRYASALDWMFLPDPADLQTRLWETLLWFHAFPPGMAALAGAMLKLGSLPVLAELLFMGTGLLLMLSLHALVRRFIGGRWVPLIVAFVFAITPPALVLEKLFLYDQPAAALLCLAAVLFARALESSTGPRWLAFGTTLTALGFLRSTFHPLWLLGLLGASMFFVRGSFKQRAFALVPSVALIGWSLKNLLLFGFFGMTSWASANLVANTTNQLSAVEKTQWIERGTLTRYAAISVFAPPVTYGSDFIVPADAPEQVTRLTRQTFGIGNFNHWLYLEVNRARGQDALAYLRERPTAYLMTVLTRGVPQYFGPTTRWHPFDRRGGPHDAHHVALGDYERWFERLMHPFAPFGLYLLVPLILVLAIRRAWRLHRVGERVQAALVAFCVLHVVAISAASCLFALGENARYRFMIEPLLWALGAFAFSRSPPLDGGQEQTRRV